MPANFSLVYLTSPVAQFKVITTVAVRVLTTPQKLSI